jgi:hypothetical protein
VSNGHALWKLGYGQMVAGLRRLGFSKFSIPISLPISHYGRSKELMQRIHQNGVLPMITSCSRMD